MNIFTANVKLYSNLSYGIMARRLFSSLKGIPTIQDEKLVTDRINWYYGEYGKTHDTELKTELATLLSFPMDNRVSNRINSYVDKYKIDLIMMHDDLQRCEWFRSVNKAPVLYWVPWDNEDTRFTALRGNLKHTDRIVVVGKFAQNILGKFGHDV